MMDELNVFAKSMMSVCWGEGLEIGISLTRGVHAFGMCCFSLFPFKFARTLSFFLHFSSETRLQTILY